MDIMAAVAQLQGKTLYTLDRNKAFDILAVTDKAIIVQPHSSGVERTISRKEIEPAYQELVARGMIERTDIRDRYSNYNPAYVVAILAALPDIRHSNKPIRLYYDRSVSE